VGEVGLEEEVKPEEEVWLEEEGKIVDQRQNNINSSPQPFPLLTEGISYVCLHYKCTSLDQGQWNSQSKHG